MIKYETVNKSLHLKLLWISDLINYGSYASY